MESAEKIESLFLSEDLSSIRNCLNTVDVTQLIHAFMFKLLKQDTDFVLSEFNVVTKTAQLFEQLRTTHDKENTSSIFHTLSSKIAWSAINTESEATRVHEVFQDKRTQSILERWDISVAAEFLSTAIGDIRQSSAHVDQFQKFKNVKNRDELFSFLQDERVLQFRKMVSKQTCDWFVLTSLKRVGEQDNERMWNVLCSAEFASTILRFPWYENLLSNRSRDPSFQADLLNEDMSPEQWLGQMMRISLSSGLVQDFYAEFPKYDAGKLAIALAENNASWDVIAKLPAEQIESFRDILISTIEKPKQEGGVRSANKILAESMRKFSKSPEQFLIALKHVQNLVEKLDGLPMRYFDTRANAFAAAQERYIDTVLGAQEELGNKHLRDKLEFCTFEDPIVLESSILKEIPKDAHSSLPVLARWFVDSTQESFRTIKDAS
ncbi:MAG: hypothetical protein AAB664_04265, partial [Patescibacteria group bacterium]